MFPNWLKTLSLNYRYLLWLIKKRSIFKKEDYSFFKPLIYIFFCPVLRVVFGRRKTIMTSRKFMKLLDKSGLLLPLPIDGMPPFFIRIRDACDFDIFREILLRNEYKKEEIKEGMVVVDVGAHIGVFSVLASVKTGGLGKVISIEPENSNFKRLEENLSINNISNAMPLKIAISNFEGKKNLFIKEDFAGHSIVSEDSAIGRVEVEVRTLDSLLSSISIRRVDILKIDTEGVELEVLEGAEKILKENLQIKLIISAYHYPEERKKVTDYLLSLGFSLFTPDNRIVFAQREP